MSTILFPFNYQPSSVVKITGGNYTIPANQYGFVSAFCERGGFITVDGVAWLETFEQTQDFRFLNSFDLVQTILGYGDSITIPFQEEWVIHVYPRFRDIPFAGPGELRSCLLISGTPFVSYGVSEATSNLIELTPNPDVLGSATNDSLAIGLGQSQPFPMTLGAGATLKNADSELAAAKQWNNADNEWVVTGSKRQISSYTKRDRNAIHGNIWLDEGSVIEIGVGAGGGGNFIVTLYDKF